ncbi:hypothetical protein FB451DRAFT_1529734 [Mycena latifolia]|nr:hypothetical protein FB451DRAFT_1529734 [Mycena latifolia]
MRAIYGLTSSMKTQHRPKDAGSRRNQESPRKFGYWSGYRGGGAKEAREKDFRCTSSLRPNCDPASGKTLTYLVGKIGGLDVFVDTLREYPTFASPGARPPQDGVRYKEAWLLRRTVDRLGEVGCTSLAVEAVVIELAEAGYALQSAAASSSTAIHAPGCETANHLAHQEVAAETVFSIQELCDHIADHIALQPSSCNTLKSAALVCRTLSAQSHLFRHVLLALSQRRGESMYGEESGGKADVSASRCLAILRASPRLSRHVRHLTILAQPDILLRVLDVRFPCLRKLSFKFVYPKWPADQSGLTHDCIALPPIREVELTDCGDCLTDLHFVASLFDNSSPQLHSLIFSYVRVSPSPPAPRPVERRLQIHQLQLYGSTDLGPWVTSQFDFTHFVEFGTDRYYDSGFRAPQPNQIADPRRVRAPVLSSLNSDNCLQRLIVHIIIHRMYPGLLFELDDIIANTSMAALDQVEVHHCSDFDENDLQSYFPELSRRGLPTLTYDLLPRIAGSRVEFPEC